MACPTARQREHQQTQIDLDQISVTAIEESGDYRVTRSKGWGPGRKIRKVIFRHLDEAPARRFYKRTPAAPGYIIALWRPDGTLIACTNGLARPAS
jgi:hypothetical protein